MQTSIIVGPFPLFCAHIACKKIEEDHYFYSGPAKILIIGKNVDLLEENRQYVYFVSGDDKNIVIGKTFIYSFEILENDILQEIFFTDNRMYGIASTNVYFFEQNEVYAINKENFDFSRAIYDQLQNNTFSKINISFSNICSQN